MMTENKINWDEEVTQKSVEEQQKEVREAKRKYADKTDLSSVEYDPSKATTESKVITWEKEYRYKGIAFKLIIIKYMNIREGFKSLNNNKICDEYVLVEYPEETKELVDILQTFEYSFSEFLYHDTLHLHNEEQTLNEQLQESYDNAIEDINTLAKNVMNNISEDEERAKECLQKLKTVLKKTDINL